MKLVKFERGNKQIYINIDTISIIKSVEVEENTTCIITTDDNVILVDGEVKEIVSKIYKNI